MAVHSLYDSFNLLSQALKTKQNTREYKRLKHLMSEDELQTLKKLQRKRSSEGRADDGAAGPDMHQAPGFAVAGEPGQDEGARQQPMADAHRPVPDQNPVHHPLLNLLGAGRRA